MKNIIKKISNPKIFVFTIIWLMILVFIGTIAQKDIGLFAAQIKYFSSVIPNLKDRSVRDFIYRVTGSSN